MDNLHKLKVKSEIFDIRGSSWVMIDLLKLFDSEISGASGTDDFYLLYIKKLQHKYRTEVKSLLEGEERIIQKDLETEIKELNEERRTKE